MAAVVTLHQSQVHLQHIAAAAAVVAIIGRHTLLVGAVVQVAVELGRRLMEVRVVRLADMDRVAAVVVIMVLAAVVVMGSS
jgi:hypothetical protein